MKKATTLIRWIVGLLFIFSGLVKANDPLGLSYKMQEFFEVWGWQGFNDYTLALSIIMNVLEVGAGVALIVGWQKKAVNWLLLLLIIFFTFLTGYALFSGKIKTCGCFGDCLPLTPAQSFGKDLVLLVLILFIFFGSTASGKSALATLVVLAVVVMVSYMQWHVLKHLPYVDCLPYKAGNDLAEQMKTPDDAIPDSTSILFKYRKNGKEVEFDQAHFPDDFDSTYEYVERVDKLVRKGNGRKAAITDFSLQTLHGNDTTVALFAGNRPYLLVFVKDMNSLSQWKAQVTQLNEAARNRKMDIWLVTAEPEKAATAFPGMEVLKCDATVIKTAARVVPTFFTMQGSWVKKKVSEAENVFK